MANGYLRSLLGEEEFEQARSGALGNAMLMAGLQGLMASGPSLTPTSLGQIVGQAGISGLEGYGQSMRQAEQQALQGRELRQQEEAKARQDAFNQALQGIYTQSGQINYPAMQRLITQFPDLAGSAVQAIKSGVRPVAKPESFTLKPGEQRFVMGADGKPVLVASADEPTDFKLDRSTMTMMANVFNTTDFDRLTPEQQSIVNQYQNAPDSAKHAELLESSNRLRYETGINIPVPKSKDQILIDLIRGGQAAPQTQTQAGTEEAGAEVTFPKAPTALQQKIDEQFASQYVEWTTGGGSDVMSQLGQIRTVIDALESGKPLTGINVAIQPDILLAMTNPEALQSRELVEGVVQRNLRIILGAQFTEKEGERLISRAYNPKLKPEQNAARLRSLFLQMSSAAEQKQAMVDYVAKNGTLRGYTGKVPSIDDFYNALESAGPSTPPGATPLNKIFK